MEVEKQLQQFMAGLLKSWGEKIQIQFLSTLSMQLPLTFQI